MCLGLGLEAGTVAQTHQPATAVMELDQQVAAGLHSAEDGLQLPASYCVE